ncbi:hypothetical protein [Azospirillum argentinense]
MNQKILFINVIYQMGIWNGITQKGAQAASTRRFRAPFAHEKSRQERCGS